MENLTELYLELRDPVFRYLYYLSGDPDQAEDLTQETFFQGLISLARFKGNSSMKTWLFSIARNTYLKNQKKSKKLMTANLAENTRSDSLATDSKGYTDDPLTYILKEEEKRSLTQLINQLPENQKTVLILREYEGWDYRELAAFLGKTENWVRVTYYRAKQQLKEQYGTIEGGDSST